MASQNHIAIVNVPSDVGSMIKGKHLAPAAFEAIGLKEKLETAGLQVSSFNALPNGPRIWTANAGFGPHGVRNEEANVEVNHEVKTTISQVLTSTQDPPFLMVIGGECNMVPAIMSTLWSHASPQRVGLLYIDADADLTIPYESGSSGNLASMTFTHLTMREGALQSMAPFTRPDSQGVCDPSNTVIFGLNMSNHSNTRQQLGYLFDEGYRVFTSASVAQDPIRTARQALKWLEERADHIMLHLDVDSIDGTVYPLANVPQRTGVEFDVMMVAVENMLSSEKVIGISIAEVNPDHDPGLKMTERLGSSVATALQKRLEKR